MCAVCVLCVCLYFIFISFIFGKGYIIVSLVVNPLILLEINEFYLAVMVFLFVSFDYERARKSTEYTLQFFA